MNDEFGPNFVTLTDDEGNDIELEYVDALDTTKLSLVGWLEVGCAITLYEDDGESTDIDLNEGLQLINVSIDKGVATAKCAGKTIDASKVVVWER